MPTLRIQLSVAALLLTVACGGVPPLGEHEKDNRLVKDVPELKHLAAALDDDDVTVKELFKGGDFVRAPDPSALFAELNARNRERTAGSMPLTVLTYNVALLHVQIFGAYEYSMSPELATRRVQMPDIVFAEEYDVVMLQEIWHEEDYNRFKDAGPAHGYRVFTQDRSRYTDGVMTFIKESIIAPDTTTEFAAEPFQDQDPKEYWPGPSVMRGYIAVSFTHKDIGPMRVFNMHMRPYPEAWKARISASREVGLAIEDGATDDEIVLVGGDMNSGPYYKDDVWEAPDAAIPDWWNNAIAWGTLQYYVGGSDLFAMGQYAKDVDLGNTVINDPHAATTIPGAAEGWCEATPPVVFSATDCNSLYFRQYAGTEFPARLDHVLARDPLGRIKVTHSALTFTDRRTWDDVRTFEVSDHFGVRLTLAVAPR